MSHPLTQQSRTPSVIARCSNIISNLMLAREEGRP